jgi:dihydrofolate reductase
MKLIAAYDKNRTIGFQNKLPWPSIRSDMRWFRDNTEYSSVIMGRNTWFSLPRKLSTRQNIVISSTLLHGPDNVVNSINEAIKVAELPIFFIGGVQVFKEAINIVNEMLITEISETYHGDTYFPEFDESLWKRNVIAIDTLCTFVKYEKLNQN